MATLTISDTLYDRLQAATNRQRQTVDAFLFEVVEMVDPTDGSLDAGTQMRDEEMQRLRDALHGRVWTEHDVRRYRARTGFPRMTADERRRVIASMPVLDPPLSATIIEMRDEERY